MIPEERYANEPHYHHLVAVFKSWVYTCQYSPQELHEMVDLAARLVAEGKMRDGQIADKAEEVK